MEEAKPADHSLWPALLLLQYAGFMMLRAGVVGTRGGVGEEWRSMGGYGENWRSEAGGWQGKWMGGNKGPWDTSSTSDSEVVAYGGQEREGQIRAGQIGLGAGWGAVVIRGSAS